MTKLIRENCRFFLAVVTVALGMTPRWAQATTINVPADQPTIQAAINAASNGDTVLVAPGTYKENINFLGKAITVTSSGGPSVTTIDGGQNAAVVTFSSAEASTSVLNGFTIQNGFSVFGGGGVFVSNSSPTITGNMIVNNQSCVGAGVTISFGSPLVKGNTISNNAQAGCSGGTEGGGIAIQGGGSAQIIGNIISNNIIDFDGGGIGMFSAGTPLIQGNMIINNSAADVGGGISMVNSSDADIIQNLIIGNTAPNGGGGVYWLVPSGNRGPLLVNNTIADNDSPNGSAIFGDGFQSQAKMVNNAIIGKTGETALLCGNFNNTVPPIIDFNDVFSSQGTAYAGICTDQTGVNGNISTDPLFVDGAANFHLQFGSPVIDVGDNSAPSLPATDLDGNPRIQNATVDMGAYEFFPSAMTLSPTSLTFAATQVGTSSLPQTITLNNTGGADLFLSVSASGDFSETNTCGSKVAAAGSCTISAVFTPTDRGTRTGQLTILSNAAGNPQSVTLTGSGTSPLAILSASALNFGDQLVGTSSAPQTVTLSNPGDLPLTISSISITTSGDFAQTSTCPLSPNTLAVGLTCTIIVTFTPSAIGPSAASVTITDDAPDTPQVIMLTGNGLAPIVNLFPSALDFATQSVGTTSPKQTVMLSNIGNAPLTITGITAAGDFAPSSTCPLAPATLAPSASCPIDVTFTPTAVGVRSGAVTIADDAVGNPQTVPLSGRGISPAAALLAWKSRAPLLDPRTGTGVEGAAASLIGGKVYVSHGYRGFDSAFLSVYDVATDSWTHGGATAPDALVARSEMAGGTALGKHYGIGGRTGPTAANEQFDPATSLWTSKASMSVARGGLGAASWQDKIYAVGGRTGGTFGTGTILGLNEVYDPSSDTWTTLAPLMVPVSDNYATVAFNGKIYVFGGTLGGNAVTSTVQIYDIASDTWTSGAAMPTARGAAMAGVISGRIAVFGGVDVNINTLAVTELYDPKSDSWEPGPDMASPANEIAQGVTSDGAQIFSIGTGIFGVAGQVVQALVGPVAQLSSSSLTFASQPVGTTSAAQTVTVTNIGSVALPVTGVSVSGDFAESDACGSSLAAGANCTITVTFKPTVVGAATGSVTIADLALDSPQAVTLAGTGADFSISANSSSATVAAGSSATYTLSIAPAGGFNQTLSLSCTGAPTLSTCNVNPMSLTLNGSSSSTATVTLTTTAPTAVGPRPPDPPRPGPLSPVGWPWLVALVMLGLSGASAARRYGAPLARQRLARLALALTMFMVLAWASCGGAAVSHMPGTPAGTYTLHLTANDTTASLSHSTTVTLIVSP
jgi:Kelch motif protein/HYDIN/CFA65/VesB family protein/centrosomal CEP192-like protein